MKGFLIVVLVGVLVGLAAGQCGGSSEQDFCVKLNGNCSSPYADCEAGTFCNGTGLPQTCVPRVKVGGNCNVDMECIDHELGSSFCWHGVCMATTFTATVGQNCSELNVCMATLYCNNTNQPYSTGVCNEYQQNGQSCDDDTLCGYGLQCNNTVTIPTGVCSPYTAFSVALGGKCNPFNNFMGLGSTDCQAGLYCNGTGYCAQGFASSNAACNSTNPSSCTNPQELCICDSNTNVSRCTAPKTLSSSDISKINALSKCFFNSNCSAQNPSCCSSEQCFLYDNIFSKTDSLFTCGYSNPYGHCVSSGLSRNEKIGIAVGIVVGIAVIIGVVVCIKKKRHHHYDSI